MLSSRGGLRRRTTPSIVGAVRRCRCRDSYGWARKAGRFAWFDRAGALRAGRKAWGDPGPTPATGARAAHGATTRTLVLGRLGKRRPAGRRSSVGRAGACVITWSEQSGSEESAQWSNSRRDSDVVEATMEKAIRADRSSGAGEPRDVSLGRAPAGSGRAGTWAPWLRVSLPSAVGLVPGAFRAGILCRRGEDSSTTAVCWSGKSVKDP